MTTFLLLHTHCQQSLVIHSFILYSLFLCLDGLSFLPFEHFYLQVFHYQPPCRADYHSFIFSLFSNRHFHILFFSYIT